MEKKSVEISNNTGVSGTCPQRAIANQIEVEEGEDNRRAPLFRARKIFVPHL